MIVEAHAAEPIANVLRGIVLDPAAHVGVGQAVVGCIGGSAALDVTATESEGAAHLVTPTST